MSGWSYHFRLVGPTALTSLLLLALCGAVAVFVYRQQTDTAEELGENIGSGRAAADLEECLVDLAALQKDPLARVGPVHERIEEHVAEIRARADKAEEQAWVRQLTAALGRYLEAHEAARSASSKDQAAQAAAA